MFCLAKSELMSIYNGQCVETLYIFTSILLSQPLHPSAKKLCINILRYSRLIGELAKLPYE